PDALECHVLLMKLAGIDGVIIDWYGNEDYLDYGAIHRNAQHLIQVIEKARMRFAICYEDQSVPRLIAGHRLPQAEAVAHGQRLLKWMQGHWFSSPAYLRLEDRPVFLVLDPNSIRIRTGTGSLKDCPGGLSSSRFRSGGARQTAASA